MKKFLGLIISIIIYVVLTTPSFYAVISSDDETIKSFGWITQFISAVIICTVTKSWVYSVLEIEE